MTYEQLVSRNGSYIPADVQQRIRETRLLIAGCGVGSNIAETAVRLGFEKFTLIDGDIVEAHNLNRQAFTASDLNQSKVHALSARLRSINPNVEIRQYNEWLSEGNVEEVVQTVDLIFDAIDLTSLEAIVSLHDECQKQHKTAISVFSIGWGAGAIHFPPNALGFREMMRLPSTGKITAAKHGQQFADAILTGLEQLDSNTQQLMLSTLNKTNEGIPCPGHVAVGYSAVASLAMTLAVRILSNQPVAAAPQLLFSNFAAACAA